MHEELVPLSKLRENACWLKAFARNVYSQTGEDGIIEKVLEVIGKTGKWCVEFGAWDGIHLSNTFNLVENHGFNSVMIEGDPNKFRALKLKFKDNTRVFPLNAFVGWSGECTLDNLLRQTPVPRSFDVLSIDIDGCDYHVWEATQEYQPALVVIEYNVTIPNWVNFVQIRSGSVSQGSSALALTKLAKEKEYELIAATDCNLFFVKKDYFSLFNIADNTLSLIRNDEQVSTGLFFGFDGTVFVRGSNWSPWHSFGIREESLQVLPWFLRGFPRKASSFKHRLRKLYLKLRILVFCRAAMKVAKKPR